MRTENGQNSGEFREDAEGARQQRCSISQAKGQSNTFLNVWPRLAKRFYKPVQEMSLAHQSQSLRFDSFLFTIGKD